MWFLQFDTFIVIILMCIAMIVAEKFKPNIRLNLLAVMSVAFVGWVSLRILAFYLVYISAIFFCAFLMGRADKAKKFFFIGGMLGCISPLVFIRLWPTQMILIIGLAFSLLRGIDALFYAYYTGEKLRARTFFNFMMFIPTFTAGPIFRYRDFDRAIENLLPVTIIDLEAVFKRMIRGFFKSLVVVQVLIQIFGHFTAQGKGFTLPISFLLIICSYFILFFNLSGYADIAIALGRLCGFVVPENFKKPWCAASFTQFWRSWHSTVSDWIREHVFILLHNKKLNRWQSAGASVVVMVIMALWHDFSVHMVLAVAFYLGSLLAIENLLGLSSPKRAWNAVRVIRCFSVNFLFGVNTLLFITDFENVQAILRGLLRLQ